MRHRRIGRPTSPAELAKVLQTLEQIQQDFNGSLSGGKKVSLADLIVLAASAAVEKAAKDAGHDITVPFAPGRTDATQEQTDVESFEVARTAGRRLPQLPSGRREGAGGAAAGGPGLHVEPDRSRDDGPRSAACVPWAPTTAGRKHGVFTDRPGTLTNDFFVNLLDMGTEWKVAESAENVYEGRDRVSGEPKWTATANDLVFGSNSILRSLAEVYATDDAKEKFVSDFVAAWVKVMNNDRFDLA